MHKPNELMADFFISQIGVEFYAYVVPKLQIGQNYSKQIVQ